MSLDGISMHPLSLEINDAISGGRIDKINQPNKQTIILALRQPGKNLLLTLSIDPQNPSIYLRSKLPENPAEPPMFCMVLRKHLEGGRIAKVYQHDLDRLIIIEIDQISRGGLITTKKLIIELMGKYSNIILVENDMIIDALRKVGTNSSRIRTILPGDEYIFPPKQDKLNLLHTDISEVIVALEGLPQLKLNKALLAICLGFGPISVKEAIFNAGLPYDIPVQELNEGDKDSLKTSLLEICTAFSKVSESSSIVLDETNKVLAMAAFPLYHLSSQNTLSFKTMSDMLERSVSLYGNWQLPDKERFKKLIKNELHRSENKALKLLEDIATADDAESYRIKADNLMTYQYQLQDRIDKEITLPNIYSESGENITIPMDQRLSIIENIQAYYKKYDKLKRGKSLLEQQLAQCREDIKYLASIEASLESSQRLAEINDIKAELINNGILREKAKKHASERPSQPFKFIAPDGTQILVGKNNYQNDRLTFKLAQPTDIWLHTKDIPGSHVILRATNEAPNENNLLLAAYLAVYFSKAKASSKVPVDYTRCKFVKKPSGAKPGFVNFTNQGTLYVTPDLIELKPILLQEEINI